MRILILGSTGMLGQALVHEAHNRTLETFTFAEKNAQFSFDIRDDQKLKEMINKIQPDVIINTVALVSHALCEQDPGIAYQVNARPTHILTQIAQEKNCYFIHISTDHYYTGSENKQHTETDPIILLNEYARTKYIGELLALTNPASLVVRTNIVGFRGQKEQPTFVEWVIKTLESNKQFTVFDDYYTSSIDVLQFSKTLFDLILNKRPSGILNLACKDVTHKKDFIFSLAKKLHYPTTQAIVGSVKALAHQSVQRAESSGLNVQKAEKLLEYKLPTFDEVIDTIASEYKRRKNESKTNKSIK